MTLNSLKCNNLTPLGSKGLKSSYSRVSVQTTQASYNCMSRSLFFKLVDFVSDFLAA